MASLHSFPLTNFRGRTSGNVVGGVWKIGGLLAQGGFGNVYKAKHIRSGISAVVKVSRNDEAESTLEKEAEINEKLRQGTYEGLLAYYGKFYIKHRTCIVLERVGEDISRVLRRHNGLGIEAACVAGRSILHQISCLHAIGYVHQDIKPGNVLGGPPGDVDSIYLCDFGLAQSFRDSHGNHISPGIQLIRCGTYGFAPMAFHRSRKQSRKDDLESFVYLLVYMITGRLPWSDWSDERNILREKERFQQSSCFCSLPRVLKIIIEYVSRLKFTDTPDYQNLIRGMDAMEQGAKLH